MDSASDDKNESNELRENMVNEDVVSDVDDDSQFIVLDELEEGEIREDNSYYEDISDKSDDTFENENEMHTETLNRSVFLEGSDRSNGRKSEKKGYLKCDNRKERKLEPRTKYKQSRRSTGRRRSLDSRDTKAKRQSRSLSASRWERLFINFSLDQDTQSSYSRTVGVSSPKEIRHSKYTMSRLKDMSRSPPVSSVDRSISYLDKKSTKRSRRVFSRRHDSCSDYESDTCPNFLNVNSHTVEESGIELRAGVERKYASFNGHTSHKYRNERKISFIKDHSDKTKPKVVPSRSCYDSSKRRRSSSTSSEDIDFLRECALRTVSNSADSDVASPKIKRFKSPCVSEKKLNCNSETLCENNDIEVANEGQLPPVTVETIHAAANQKHIHNIHIANENYVADQKNTNNICAHNQEDTGNIHAVKQEYINDIRTANQECRNDIAHNQEHIGDIFAVKQEHINGIPTANQECRNDIAHNQQRAGNICSVKQEHINDIRTANQEWRNDIHEYTESIYPVNQNHANNIYAANQKHVDNTHTANEDHTNNICTVSHKHTNNFYTANPEYVNSIYIAGQEQEHAGNVCTTNKEHTNSIHSDNQECTNDICVANGEDTGNIYTADQRYTNNINTANQEHEEHRDDVYTAEQRYANNINAANQEHTDSTHNVPYKSTTGIHNMFIADEEHTDNIYRASQRYTNNIDAGSQEYISNTYNVPYNSTMELTTNNPCTSNEQHTGSVCTANEERADDIYTANEEPIDDVYTANEEPIDDIYTANEEPIDNIVEIQVYANHIHTTKQLQIDKTYIPYNNTTGLTIKQVTKHSYVTFRTPNGDVTVENIPHQVTRRSYVTYKTPHGDVRVEDLTHPHYPAPPFSPVNAEFQPMACNTGTDERSELEDESSYCSSDEEEKEEKTATNSLQLDLVGVEYQGRINHEESNENDHVNIKEEPEDDYGFPLQSQWNRMSLSADQNEGSDKNMQGKDSNGRNESSIDNVQRINMVRELPNENMVEANTEQSQEQILIKEETPEGEMISDAAQSCECNHEEGQKIAESQELIQEESVEGRLIGGVTQSAEQNEEQQQNREDNHELKLIGDAVHDGEEQNVEQEQNEGRLIGGVTQSAEQNEEQQQNREDDHEQELVGDAAHDGEEQNEEQEQNEEENQRWDFINVSESDFNDYRSIVSRDDGVGLDSELSLEYGHSSEGGDPTIEPCMYELERIERGPDFDVASGLEIASDEQNDELEMNTNEAFNDNGTGSGNQNQLLEAPNEVNPIAEQVRYEWSDNEILDTKWNWSSDGGVYSESEQYYKSDTSDSEISSDTVENHAQNNYNEMVENNEILSSDEEDWLSGRCNNNNTNCSNSDNSNELESDSDEIHDDDQGYGVQSGSVGCTTEHSEEYRSLKQSSRPECDAAAYSSTEKRCLKSNGDIHSNSEEEELTSNSEMSYDRKCSEKTKEICGSEYTTVEHNDSVSDGFRELNRNEPYIRQKQNLEQNQNTLKEKLYGISGADNLDVVDTKNSTIREMNTDSHSIISGLEAEFSVTGSAEDHSCNDENEDCKSATPSSSISSTELESDSSSESIGDNSDVHQFRSFSLSDAKEPVASPSLLGMKGPTPLCMREQTDTPKYTLKRMPLRMNPIFSTQKRYTEFPMRKPIKYSYLKNAPKENTTEVCVAPSQKRPGPPTVEETVGYKSFSRFFEGNEVLKNHCHHLQPNATSDSSLRLEMQSVESHAKINQPDVVENEKFDTTNCQRENARNMEYKNAINENNKENSETKQKEVQNAKRKMEVLKNVESHLLETRSKLVTNIEELSATVTSLNSEIAERDVKCVKLDLLKNMVKQLEQEVQAMNNDISKKFSSAKEHYDIILTRNENCEKLEKMCSSIGPLLYKSSYQMPQDNQQLLRTKLLKLTTNMKVAEQWQKKENL